MKEKKAVFLFNDENPRGEMFTLTQSEIDEMLQSGWYDTPARLDLPDSNDTGLTIKQVENARPEDLVKLVESYGFIVLTPEQLKAEANKIAAAAFDPANLTDNAIISEAERRGLKSQSGETNELLELFNEEPEALNKDELVTLGNSLYSLGLRTNMKEDTLIAKIQEALES